MLAHDLFIKEIKSVKKRKRKIRDVYLNIGFNARSFLLMSLLLSVFLVFLIFIPSVFGVLNFSCKYGNSNGIYDINSVLEITAFNGYTCCNEIKGNLLINNLSFEFNLNDLGKDCDNSPEDGFYCGLLDLKKFDLSSLFNDSKSKDDNKRLLNATLQVEYSKIALENISISLIDYDHFDVFYNCQIFNFTHALCNILSDSKVFFEDKLKFSFILPQGKSVMKKITLVNSFCGMQNKEFIFEVPDFYAPEKPQIDCKLLSDSRVRIELNNIKDNSGVDQVFLIRKILNFNATLSDLEKLNSLMYNDLDLNPQMIDEILQLDSQSQRLMRLNITPLSPETNLYFDYCNNCENEYFVIVKDTYGNYNFSKKCHVVLDSTPPQIFPMLLLQNDSLVYVIVSDSKVLLSDTIKQKKLILDKNYNSEIFNFTFYRLSDGYSALIFVFSKNFIENINYNKDYNILNSKDLIFYDLFGNSLNISLTSLMSYIRNLLFNMSFKLHYLSSKAQFSENLIFSNDRLFNYLLGSLSYVFKNNSNFTTRQIFNLKELGDLLLTHFSNDANDECDVMSKNSFFFTNPSLNLNDLNSFLTHKIILFGVQFDNPCEKIKDLREFPEILILDETQYKNFELLGDYSVLYVNESEEVDKKVVLLLKNTSLVYGTSLIPFSNHSIVELFMHFNVSTPLHSLENIDVNVINNLDDFISLLNSSLRYSNYDLIKSDYFDGFIIKESKQNLFMKFISAISGTFVKVSSSVRQEIREKLSYLSGVIALLVIVFLFLFYLLYRFGNILNKEYESEFGNFKHQEGNAELSESTIKKIEQRFKEKEEEKTRLKKYIERAIKTNEK